MAGVLVGWWWLVESCQILPFVWQWLSVCLLCDCSLFICSFSSRWVADCGAGCRVVVGWLGVRFRPRFGALQNVNLTFCKERILRFVKAIFTFCKGKLDVLKSGYTRTSPSHFFLLTCLGVASLLSVCFVVQVSTTVDRVTFR